jgi:molybdopterin-guanine dinucleotide biosynthesis protein A
VHPVFCQCRRDVLSGLTDYLACGQRKMGAWLATLKRVEVAFDDQAEAFENINTRAGLGRFEGDGTRR